MIKHVGKHNQRKVAIVYRSIPGEDHMALVLYTETLPMMIHDELMKVIESQLGQDAKELADAMFKHIMADGNNCLTSIHKGGWMKKVPTNQVIVTPTPSASVRLDELNDIMAKLEAGGEAADRLKDLDQTAGFVDPTTKKKAQAQAKTSKAEVNTTSINDVLTDADIAKQRLEQAAKMKAEANSLLAEAKRLEDEAKSLAPAKKTNARKPTTKKATA